LNSTPSPALTLNSLRRQITACLDNDLMTRVRTAPDAAA